MAWNLSSVLAPLAVLLTLWPSAVSASDAPRKQHALSLIGEPKYGPDFKHFDWVNPSAPRGGRVRQWAMGTFDTLNPFPVKGTAAAALMLIYDTLMVESPDEPSTEYGLIAEWVSHPDDYSSATFQLREGARFHDGKSITPDDVVFSLEAIKKASPRFAFYYKNVVKAEKVGDRQVRFEFDVKGNRELPLIVSQLPILPKHFWEGTGANGEPRDLSKATLEIPLGSGPYRIAQVDAGRSITYERVKDWWAKDLPVAKGQWNFEEMKFVYFRARDAGFLAFKAGELDFWRETSAKAWATAFDFDAIKRGQVAMHQLPTASVAPMQSFAFNIRRPQFQDPRVRQAFNLAFNFEWTNKNLMFGAYHRVGSFFDNSELKATGLPEGRELEMLNGVRALVPPEVFTKEWKNPVNHSEKDARQHMAMAMKLLAEAGYQSKGGVLTNAAGMQLAAEFLLVQPDFERLVLPYVKELEKLGIKASVRTVDTSQYQRRVDTFDFDIIVQSFAQSLSPGNEQRNYWGSDAAGKDGSQNVIGIKNPAIDKLIDKIILAKDRADLVAATRALDRVLLWNHYVVPQWHAPFERVAMWNMYRRPDKLPSRNSSFMRVWWWDDSAAKRLADGRG
ncbi:MAG: extracellular solute-binding protein [Hyphomonadaceae bacterium]|jgi:microcin C transport system substrate-binding protein|nr:extracellular solute-binding protein [Hyphomonadaceae bacterium]